MFKYKSQLTQQQGFSMVEALVAIAVLTIGVIGPLTLLAGAINNANYAKNQITAFFLAQEAQELVINQRDQNILVGKNSGFSQLPDGSLNPDYWLSGGGLRKCVTGGTANVCYIDAYQQVSGASADADGNFIKCPSGSCPVMTLRANGFYGYQAESEAGVKKTIFNRQIEIIPKADDTDQEREALVKVTIKWTEKNLTRTFTLNSIIFRY